MSIYKRNISIPLPRVILALFFLLIGVFIWVFFGLLPQKNGLYDVNGAFLILASGLVPGLIVALGQYLLSWFEFTEMARLRALKIKNILISRDDEAYYRTLIQNAKDKIQVLGVTASRFLDDFAEEKSPKLEKKVLLDALKRGVSVCILVAGKDFLEPEDQREKFPSALRKLEKLAKEYPGLFEYKYYMHIPTNSLVVVDDDCLFGPVFNAIDSQNTPTVHTSRDSPYAKAYLKYFENEWSNAKSKN